MEHYFDDTSLLREVVGHRLTGLSGPRALLVMAAHPVAFAGFFAHTGALDDPYARLQRTATVMDAVAFGTKARADKLTAHVRAMHRRVRGELTEAGRAVPRRHALPRRRSRAAAVDPGRARGVGDARLRPLRALAVARRAGRAVAATTASSGAASGSRDATCRATSTPSRPTWPTCTPSGELYVTPAARELAIDIVMHPPVPLRAKPLVELVNQITIGWLPRRRPPPVRLPLGPAAGASRCAAGRSTSKRLVLPAAWPAPGATLDATARASAWYAVSEPLGHHDVL